MNEKIGIFYIATGIYKKYFDEFYKTIDYIFPDKLKTLIIISDGLSEYNNTHKNLTDIFVENFIDYPYPLININKFQIINHYAKKYDIDIIVYFDSETYFIEKDKEFFDNLINISKSKLISLIPPYFLKFDFRGFIYSMNEYTLWGKDNGFDDFSFFYKDKNYNNIDTSYKWIQTSFFMCSKEILDDINNMLKDLISYNMRVMGCKLNYSDEFYINYLNLYYPEKFYADFYAESGDLKNDKEILFMYQKLKMINGKLNLKFGNLNYNFRMHILNNSSDKQFEVSLNKFFITHRNKFLMLSYGQNLYYSKIFFNYVYLYDYWFDKNHNIITEKTFYSNDFIQLWSKENLYIGFINKINDYSNNFDYDKFYNEEYDYIEGYSFDEIKNMNFYDIDMCCFSKKYIEAYFNNDLEFKPKIYNIK